MLLYPSVDKLLEQVDSRYSLIMLLANGPMNWMLGQRRYWTRMNLRKPLVKLLKRLPLGRSPSIQIMKI